MTRMRLDHRLLIALAPPILFAALQALSLVLASINGHPLPLIQPVG